MCITFAVLLKLSECFAKPMPVLRCPVLLFILPPTFGKHWQLLKPAKCLGKKRHAKHVLGTYELLLLKNFPSQKKKVRKLGPTRQRHQKYIELPCAIHKCLNACVNLKSVAMSKIKNDMSDAV